MSEYHTSGVLVFDAAQIRAAEAIENEALTIVERRFGTGYPDYEKGEQGGLAYHNRHHSEAVLGGTLRMSAALGLSAGERAIGAMAAAAHDIVQLKPRGLMEQESADWLEVQMRQWGIFSGQAIRIGMLAILGTEPLFEGNRLSGQAVDTLVYPSRSAESIARSVACGDFAELHALQGPLLGHELFKEINGVPPAEQPPMENLIRFQLGQVALAETYAYPHPEGERQFGALRGKVTAYQVQVLSQLERGAIETWDQLLTQDKAFMLANS